MTTIAVATLTCVFLCRLLIAWLFAPDVWVELFYVRWFLYLAFAGLWGALLFPLETRTLASALTRGGRSLRSPQPALLAATAAIAVSCGNLAFVWARTSGTAAILKGEVIRKRAWATSSLILFARYALPFALTRRLPRH